MTEKQTVEIVTTICMSYPSFEKLGADAIKGMVRIWAMLFADDDYNLVQLAVAKHIATSKWPPSVSEIREQMVRIEHPELIPPDRAWQIVNAAISAFGEFGHYTVKMDAFPPLIAQTLSSIGWSKLWALKEPRARGLRANLDRSVFMEMYKPAYERERERLMLPRGIAGRIIDSESALEPAKRMIAEKRDENRRAETACYGELEASEYELLTKGKEETWAITPHT